VANEPVVDAAAIVPGDVLGVQKGDAAPMVDATSGQPAVTSSVILWSSALISAAVDNIPFVAAMIPVIREVGPQLAGAEHLVNVLWWSLALGTCLGGNGTLIGASANLTVAGLAQRHGMPFSFWTYTKTAFPLMLMSVLISQVYLHWRYL
jgi:Na+/H+ antiporter NhaD/arsenite permease-like protein